MMTFPQRQITMPIKVAQAEAVSGVSSFAGIKGKGILLELDKV